MAQGTQEEQIRAVQAWLANHSHWLLIFDNADHPQWLLPFLPNNPQGRILLTARATLFDSLGITQPLVLDVLLPAAACDLLFARTGYECTEVNQQAAVAINQELDGLPLALEQASAFMRRQRIPLPIYLATYRKRGLSQLEAAKAQTGQYPSSVLRTWALNVQAVSEEQPEALELFKFSAFLAPDEIPYFLLSKGAVKLGKPLASHLQREDADEMTLAFSHLLEPLSQYSLIKWLPEREVYSVHRLVQAVTRDELDASEQATRIGQVIAAMSKAYPGPGFQHWSQCSQLLPHWLQGFEHAQRANIESKELSTLLSQAGYFLHDQGRYREVEPLWQGSLAISKRLLGNNHLAVATDLNNLAMLFRAQGRYDEAEPLLQEALTLYRRLSNGHRHLAGNLYNLARLYYAQRRYNEAEPLCQEALEIRQQWLGNDHPTTVNSLELLAMLHRTQGHYNEAESLYQEVLELRRQQSGNDHPGVANTLNNLAELCHAQKRYNEAEPLWQEALEINQRRLGNDHPDVASNLLNLAALRYEQGQFSSAKSFLLEALKISQASLGLDHPNTKNAQNWLAAIHVKLGAAGE